jgi:hypothetical protein
MLYVLMFGVMLIFAYTMFVCIATSSSEVTSHLKTMLVPGNLESKASCALDHFSLYLIMFLLIIVTCLVLGTCSQVL